MSNTKNLKIKQTVYEHGGSRIWVEMDDGSRDLLADTYDSAELASEVLKAIESYFENAKYVLAMRDQQEGRR